ncbi:MAG: AlpA family phage regulatory protein [Alphaproteobacteria bacterium]|nr:AlpA family phage regulatory protein [Alphaproteobacteria bacterium]
MTLIIAQGNRIYKRRQQMRLRFTVTTCSRNVRREFVEFLKRSYLLWRCSHGSASMPLSTRVFSEAPVTTAPERFVTMADVCAMLARSRASIYRDIEKRVFPKPIKQGGSSRWLASDIAAHTARCTAASRA